MAAPKTFRNASVYINSRKVAEIESGTYEHNSGDEAQFGSEGWMGHSDGAGITRLTFNTVVPAVGHEITFSNIIKNKEYAQVAVIIDGRAELLTMRIMSRSYNFDSRAGTVKGAFTAEGGEPEFA
jgi:hypothetical protein